VYWGHVHGLQVIINLKRLPLRKTLHRWKEAVWGSTWLEEREMPDRDFVAARLDRVEDSVEQVRGSVGRLEELMEQMMLRLVQGNVCNDAQGNDAELMKQRMLRLIARGRQAEEGHGSGEGPRGRADRDGLQGVDAGARVEVERGGGRGAGGFGESVGERQVGSDLSILVEMEAEEQHIEVEGQRQEQIKASQGLRIGCLVVTRHLLHVVARGVQVEGVEAA
jgi:hypothetical protein